MSRSFPLPGSRPHYGPDKVVDILHIDLHLTPDLEAKTLAGVCTTTLEAIDEGVRELRFDAVDLEIANVRDGNGTALAFRATSEALVVVFAEPLAARETATVAIAYRVVQARRGLYFVDEPRHVWTQSQDSDARFWFPCMDYPSEKQTTSTTIVVRKGLFALGNGALVDRHDDGETTVFRYEQRIPHATYLMTMVAGPFAEIEQRATVPLWYYVHPGREVEGERSFGKTPKMIETFERVIGVPYPYERYAQIAVSDFIFGGMENTGAATQTDRTLHDERAHLDFASEPLVSHELAHQWFGDLLTCRDWSQAWLNEGFATYFEAVFTEADLGWDEYCSTIHGLVSDYVHEDSARYRRPIVCNLYRDPIELFDAHLYQKGGAVLHMLRGELGWERMQRSLRRYVEDNATLNVETIDLVRAIEYATGRNLRQFFAQWIERAGHPQLSIASRYDAEKKLLVIDCTQKQPIDEAAPAYVFDVNVGVVASKPAGFTPDFGDGALAGETRVRFHVERATESFAIPCESEPALVRFDPGAYILAEVTYTFSADMLAAILTSDPDPTARIRAAEALGKDGARLARESLAKALSEDPFWGVAAEVAAVLGTMHSPAARAALVATIDHPHPKVRRAIVTALGQYRGPDVAGALLRLTQDRSYFVSAAAYESLGKTRDARAFDALVAGLATTSWLSTTSSGALRGLAELADPRAVPYLIEATGLPHAEPHRRAAIKALARAGALNESERTRVVDALAPHFDDPAYFIRYSAIAAAETLGDSRLLVALDRAAQTEIDGRLKRDAAEAAVRVREAQSVPAEVSRMRGELDTLREELQAVRARIDEITTK